MNNLKLTLKWRFTLLAMLLITLASISIVLAMNIDVGRNMSNISASITSSPTATLVPTNSDIPLESQLASEVYSSTISTAAFNIYTSSIVILVIIVILGGVSAYFISDKMLQPIQILNENIKNINEHNLLSALVLEGPRDEIQELTFSFNQMLSKLDNAFASQKRFNSSVAHELKTPLAAIKTNIDVLNDTSDKSLEDYAATLTIVEKSIKKMDTMIEALLDLVRTENASLDDTVYLDQIIEDVLEDLSSIAKIYQVSLVCRELSTIPPIRGNEILLYRAIYNLVENSIKYNKADGMVDIYCEQHKDFITIEIKDTGRGIPSDALNSIFEPFYQLDSPNTHTSSSIGLGLSLVKSTVTLHGGEIKLESEVDRGTKIEIRLPIFM